MAKSFPMKKYLLSKRAWVGVAVIVLLAGCIGLLRIVRYAHTGPLHCGSCHPEETQQWQQSGVHSEETHCIDCHARAARLLPTSANVVRDYRDAFLPTNVMARGETVAENCLRCHESVLGSSYAPIGVVSISHRVHREEGMICIDCHRNISHDTMTGATYRPPKRVCYECHLRDIDVGSSQDQSCAHCHRIILSRGDGRGPKGEESLTQ